MNLANALPIFLADFGVDVMFGNTPVRCIFDADYAESFDLVAGNQPSLLCPSAAVADVARGTMIAIDSIVYTIEKPLQPDGTGMTRLLLRTA